MKQISTEIQREAMGRTAEKNSGKTYCCYSLIFDPTTYVLWPAGFQVLSSPQVQTPYFQRKPGRWAEGLVPPAQPQGMDDAAVGWEPAHPLAPAGGDHSPCSWGICSSEGLGTGNKGKKKGGNTHLEN